MILEKKTILGGLKSKSQHDKNEKLCVFATPIDTDNNRQISREEMRTCTEQRIK
jgi:hypothetical protein